MCKYIRPVPAEVFRACAAWHSCSGTDYIYPMSLAVNAENDSRTVVLYMPAHASAVDISFPLRRMVLISILRNAEPSGGGIEDVRLLSHM